MKKIIAGVLVGLTLAAMAIKGWSWSNIAYPTQDAPTKRYPRNPEATRQLFQAVQKGTAADVAQIIETTKINVNDPLENSPDGDTPLHKAARRGDPAIIAVLLNARANPFQENKAGRVPKEVAGSVEARNILNRERF